MRSHLPPLRFHALTRWYDFVLAATLKEKKLKGLLLDQADLRPGNRVLDLGCGTGTLTLMMKRACPDADVVGVDPDRAALARARRKAREARVTVHLVEGSGADAPLDDRPFDRIVSSLVFHHLVPSEKRRTLARAYGLVRPGGAIHIADWGRADDIGMRLAFLGIQLLDGFATTSDNVKGLLPSYMRDAGFSSVRETHRERTIFGTFALYRGLRP